MTATKMKVNSSNLINFFSHVDFTSTCWNWTGAKQGRRKCKYGQIGSDVYGTSYAHRYSYWAFNGGFNKNLCVLHRCDNAACVNPEHLFLGTQQDNVTDCKNKGRIYNREGEKNPKVKLTWHKVNKIIELYLSNKYSYSQLNKKFKVGKSTITNILVGNTWR